MEGGFREVFPTGVLAPRDLAFDAVLDLLDLDEGRDVVMTFLTLLQLLTVHVHTTRSGSTEFDRPRRKSS